MFIGVSEPTSAGSCTWPATHRAASWQTWGKCKWNWQVNKISRFRYYIYLRPWSLSFYLHIPNLRYRVNVWFSIFGTYTAALIIAETLWSVPVRVKLISWSFFAVTFWDKSAGGNFEQFRGGGGGCWVGWAAPESGRDVETYGNLEQSRSRFQRNTQQHLGPYAPAKQVTGYTAQITAVSVW